MNDLINNFTKNIEGNKNYRGQCVYTYKKSYSKSHFEKVEEADEKRIKICWIYNNNLFKHQKECLTKFEENQNILLLSSYFSGRSTCGTICAIKTIFDKAKFVLYICPDEYTKKIQMKDLNRIIKELNYEWLIEPQDVKNIKPENIFPSLLVTDIQHLHSKLLPEHSKYPLFWSSLGLVVIDNFDSYPGILASNVALVIKRLKRIIEINKGEIQFLILSKPFLNAESYAKRFLGVEKISVINYDGRGDNSASINFWIPALTSAKTFYEENEKQHRVELKRTDYFEEILFLALEGVLAGLNTVIYYAGIPLGKQLITEYERRITESIKQCEDKKTGKWFVGDKLDEITLALQSQACSWGDIDLIIVAGFLGPLSSVRDDLVHLGAQDCLIYFVLPQFPYYQFYINHSEELATYPGTDRIRTEEKYIIFNMNESDNEIKKRHFLFCLNEKPYEYGEKTWETETNIIDELNNEGLIKEQDEKFILSEEGQKTISEILKFEGKDLYTTSFGNAYKIKSGNEIIRLCDPFEAFNVFFPNAMVSLFNKRYRVTAFENKDKEITIQEEDTHYATFPYYEKIKIINEKKEEKFIYNNQLTISFGTADIELELGRGKSSIRHNLDDIKPFTLKPLIPVTESISFLKFGEFKDKVIAHTFGHLFYIAMRTRFGWYSLETPKFFIIDKNIYLYFPSTFGKDVFLSLTDIPILKDLLERMFQILIDCPCSSGCPGCLHIFECSKNIEKPCELNKCGCLEFLGTLLKRKEEAQRESDYRTVKEKDTNTLKATRDKSIKILKEKVKMEIKNPLNELFFTPEDYENHLGCTGVCTERNVKVIEKLKEEDLLEVVAHEYTHNWQIENNNLNNIFTNFNDGDIDAPENILFAGKLFREGHAMFGALKVLDYYGIDKKAIASAKMDYYEYREGLKLMLYLEKEFGLQELLNILKTGEIEEEIDKKIVKKMVDKETLKNWYKKSGVYAGITGEGGEIRKANGLLCLGKDYLNKELDDLNRVSYHLQAIIRTKKKGEVEIGKLIEDQEKKGIIWKHLKEAIKEINPDFNQNLEIPCLNCSQKEKETLEDVCILFKSKEYADKIWKELNIK